jgi:hypothetical protein
MSGRLRAPLALVVCVVGCKESEPPAYSFGDDDVQGEGGPASGLDASPDARDAGSDPHPDDGGQQVDDAGGLDRDAAPPPSCEVQTACTSRTYPCMDLEPWGYTCQGLHAEWPMPSTVPGAGTANSYDTESVALVTIDEVTGLWWEREPPATAYTWTAAEERCAALALGGFDDWRLPSMIELVSLVDELAVDAPLIDRAAFPGTLGADYWSATRPSDVQALVVAFDVDWAYRHTDVEASRASRCVRGSVEGRFTPAARYRVDEASDTVTDTRTGLVWERTVEDPFVYDDAVAHCSALGAGFRLPTFKELFTLADRSRINPAIDPVFPATPSRPFWSAVSKFGSKTLLNAVVFDDGEPDAIHRATLTHGRCVR